MNLGIRMHGNHCWISQSMAMRNQMLELSLIPSVSCFVVELIDELDDKMIF